MKLGEDMMSNQEVILVLDFGSKSNQLLTRKIRELGVYSELHANKTSAEEIKALNPKGLILSGGNLSANDASLPYDEEIFDLDIPILGINYGMQLMALHYGGNVPRSKDAIDHEVTIKADQTTTLFAGTADEQSVHLNNGDDVLKAPLSFTVDAKAEDDVVIAMSHKEEKRYGVGFHPEQNNVTHGSTILKNFLYTICKCEGTWTMENFIHHEIENIQKRVGDKKVLCALSGGVDSSVVAALIHKAIGDQLTCIFVDHGLLRKNEAKDVMEVFAEDFHMNIISVDAKDRFLSKLKGVTDPETKRKIIGNEFIYVFDDEASKLENIDFLAQGTLYSDVIESGVESGEVIKSHHNVGGLPEDMEFELIEPISSLFKNEVRELGIALGMPEHIVWRQPFPGPGLGIRILGEVTEEKLEIVRESDAILREEIAAAGLDRDIWQYFTVLPNIRSVGVKNDVRTYDHTIGIRAVHSVDGMTSDWARIPWDVLERVSKRLVTDVEHINRVVYDITSKPPATIEWE